MPEVNCYVKLDGRKCLLSSNYPSAKGVANSYTCSIGVEPGVAVVVMLRKDVAMIDRQGPITLTFVSQETVELQNLYFAEAHQIVTESGSPDWPNNPDAPMLVKLFDPREQFKFSTIDSQYNVRNNSPSATGELYDESLFDGNPWTWQLMLNDLWDALPSSAGPAPELSNQPNGRPENMRFVGARAIDAIEETLDALGLVLVYDPVIGKFEYQDFTDGQPDAIQAIKSNQQYERDTGTVYGFAGRAPKTITVFFPKFYDQTGSQAATGKDNNYALESTYTIAVPTDAGLGASGDMPIWNRLPALCNFAGQVQNIPALQERADAIATGIINRLTAHGSRRRWLGNLNDIRPGTVFQRVTWRNFDVAGGACTEVVGNIGIDYDNPPGPEAFHFVTGKPDSTYPQLMQIVEVDTGGSPGTPAVPNAQNLISGVAIRVDATKALNSSAPYIPGEPCWILSLDRQGAPHNLTNLDFHMGRLSGYAYAAGESRPLYVIQPPGGNNPLPVRFRLSETLLLNNPVGALANILTHNGSGALVEGAQIRVGDFTTEPGIFAGRGTDNYAKGYEGWAIALPDMPQTNPPSYEIIYMEFKAKWIYAKLVENMGYTTPYEALCSVENYWDGKEPTPGTVKNVIVRDILSQHSAWRTGQKTLACYEENEDKYIAVAGENTPLRFRLVDDLSLGSTNGALANILFRNGAGALTVGPSIRVYDFTKNRGIFKGRGDNPYTAGYEGWCIALADNKIENPPRFEIIYMERKAVFVTATLTQDMGATTANEAQANVGAYWQGKDPVPGAGETIQIVDSMNEHSDWKSGQKTIGCYDESTGKYRVVSGAGTGDTLTRFILDADLPPWTGNEPVAAAQSKIIEWKNNNWAVANSQSILVYDPEHVGPAASGKRGWAVFKADSNKYEAVALDNTAHAPQHGYIYGTLTAGGSVNCRGMKWNGTAWVSDPSNQFTLYDPQRLGPAVSGNLCWYTFDDVSEHWEMLSKGNAGATLKRFELYGALVEGGNALARGVIWTGATWAVDPLDTFTVHDPQNIGPAGIGKRGWCENQPDSNLTEVISLDNQASEPPFRIRLYDTLALGGSALADVMTWNGNAYVPGGTQITVHDYAGQFSGRAGYAGFACAINGVNEIIWLAEQAELVIFELTGDWTAPDVAIAAKIYGDGFYQGIAQVIGASTPFDVWDSSVNFAEARSGDRGIATWNDVTGKYVITSMRIPYLVRFELYDDLTKGGNALADIVRWDGAAWVVSVQPADRFTAYDSQKLGPASKGARGWVVWKKDSKLNEIVSIDHDPGCLFIKTTEQHTLMTSDKSNDHYVMGQKCGDSTGAGATGTAIKVYLPCPTSALCPNVEPETVVEYLRDKNGRNTAIGSYLDSNRGASRQHYGSEGDLPFGWSILAGSQGKFLLMSSGDLPSDPDFDGLGHGNATNNTGGEKDHTHTSVMNTGGDDPVPGRIRHSRSGSFTLRTENTNLKVDASPGAQVATNLVTLVVDSYGTLAADVQLAGDTLPYAVSVTGIDIPIDISGTVAPAKANVTIDAGGAPERDPSFHPDHIHVWNGGAGDAQSIPCGNGQQRTDSPEGPENFQIVYTSKQLLGTGDPCGAGAPTTAYPFKHEVVDPTHTHGLNGSATIDTLTLAEPSPGHVHSFDVTVPVYAPVNVFSTITPADHSHNVPVKSVADAMYIVDVTHANTQFVHYHGLTVDDHNLKKAKHIPPYLALLQIVRSY